MRKAKRAGKITEGQYRKARAVSWPIDPEILGESIKTNKSIAEGYLSAVVYMAPASESVPYGGHNACPFASPGCALACLGIRSARLRMPDGANSKAWKTLLWIYRPDLFKSLLWREVYNLRNRAHHQGLTPAARLNGSSDYAWERKFRRLMTDFPDVVFYDYSKSVRRVLSLSLPSNYHLTFSRSETNERDALRVLKAGRNVAVVFTNLKRAIRSGWRGYRVIDGDKTDARPTDAQGVVVGLSPKARVTDTSGFFVHN